MDLNELKNKFVEVLEKEDYNEQDFLRLLTHISKYIDNEAFKTHLKEVVDVLIHDRNGDNKFSMEDLELLSRDVFAISVLINSLLLVLGSVKDIKFKNDRVLTEKLILELLLYLLLIVLPKHANLEWSLKNRKQMLNVFLNIYDVMRSSQVVKSTIANVISWFKTTRLYKKCRACYINDDHVREELVKEKMPLTLNDLQNIVENNRHRVQTNKDIRKLQDEIDELKQKLEK